MPPQVPQENITFQQPSQGVLWADRRKTNVSARLSRCHPGELFKAAAEPSKRGALPEGTAGLHSAGPDYELQLAGCPRLLLISEAQLPGSRGREIPSVQRRRVPPSAPARPAAAAGTPRSSSANICCRPARAPSAAPGAPPGGSPPSLPPRRLLIYLLSRPRLAPRPEPRRGCEGRRRGGFAPARR